MNLSENLKRIRKENNLSQEQLAEKLNVSRQSVSKWESGQAFPEMDKVIQICQLFNVSVDDLLNQDIKELNNNKIAKSNINKFIDDILDYVTKIIDLFGNLKFKDKLKCIFEQLLLILIFYVVSMLILSLVDSFLIHLLSFLPSGIKTFIYNLLSDIGVLCLSVLSIALLFHIFKIRYLNYYVIANNDIENQKDDISDKDEIIVKKQSNKVAKNEKIIIRDPKHASYNFISSIIKCFIFLIKIFMSILALFICAGFVFFITCLIISFSIIKTGLLFVGLLFVLLGIIVLLGQVIIVIFNFITNRKNSAKRIGIILISTLISIGVGIGFILLSLPKFDYYDVDSSQYVETTQEFEINNDVIFNSCNWYNYNVNYIEEDRKNILIKVFHYKNNDIFIERYNDNNDLVSGNIDGDYIYIYNEIKDINFKFIKNFINDINNYKIVKYDKVDIYIYGNKENLELIKKQASNYC